jgi:sugar-phosphatase
VPPPQRASAIVFDLDGVLVDSYAVVERAWRRWATETGLDENEVAAVVHGRPGRDVIRELAPDRDVEADLARVDAWEADLDGVVVVPGARACLEIAQRGPWAIVTSGSTTVATRRLEAFDLPRPSILITADDVTRGKPDPQPYSRASQHLGIAPHACTVIEDTPAGVAAAKAAGMTVLAVATTHAPAQLAQADDVLAGMDAVAGRLRAVR